MKHIALVTMVLAVVASHSPSAHAQTAFGQGFGEIYLVFDVEDRNSTCVEAGSPDAVPTFVPFDFFLVVNVDFEAIGQGQQNATNGLAGWEVLVNVPPEITVAGQVLNPSTSINVAGAPGGWIVGTGAVVTASSMPYALVNYSGILLQDVTDLSLTFGIPAPSSFDITGGPGAVPGWLEENPAVQNECSNGACIRPFTGWDASRAVNENGRCGCAYELVVNASQQCDCATPLLGEEGCPVPVFSESWGAVKARF